MGGGCEICTPLAWSELALLSDISKLDRAGGKFKLLPEYLMERDMWCAWWLILKRKIHAIPQQKYISTFIARILYTYVKSRKMAKIEKKNFT